MCVYIYLAYIVSTIYIYLDIKPSFLEIRKDKRRNQGKRKNS